jgi:hypothetical protein
MRFLRAILAPSPVCSKHHAYPLKIYPFLSMRGVNCAWMVMAVGWIRLKDLFFFVRG